jgi:hypothetical protein
LTLTVTLKSRLLAGLKGAAAMAVEQAIPAMSAAMVQ